MQNKMLQGGKIHKI